jgi:ribosomal protein S18 acetylase RimI-like enzyme
MNPAAIRAYRKSGFEVTSYPEEIEVDQRLYMVKAFP